MANPYRGNTGNGTYFISTNCYEQRFLLQSERMAKLLIETIYHYREAEKFLLHEFVVMPNHLHLILTPEVPLERAMQLVKGGFSYRAKKLLGIGHEIWQTSFNDRRLRDMEEYEKYKVYVHDNPVKAGLCAACKDWPYGSASGKYALDEVPRRLKPDDV